MPRSPIRLFAISFIKANAPEEEQYPSLNDLKAQILNISRRPVHLASSTKGYDYYLDGPRLTPISKPKRILRVREISLVLTSQFF